MRRYKIPVKKGMGKYHTTNRKEKLRLCALVDGWVVETVIQKKE